MGCAAEVVLAADEIVDLTLEILDFLRGAEHVFKPSSLVLEGEHLIERSFEIADSGIEVFVLVGDVETSDGFVGDFESVGFDLVEG